MRRDTWPTLARIRGRVRPIPLVQTQRLSARCNPGQNGADLIRRSSMSRYGITAPHRRRGAPFHLKLQYHMLDTEMLFQQLVNQLP